MKRHNFFLPEPLVTSLKALAQKTDVPMSEHIRRALEDYLKGKVEKS